MSHSKETKAPMEPSSEDWTALPWRKLERHLYRLQKRIYRASERGNVQAVHRLQQLLTRSRSARLLAVRRVTQDNQGKKTAGIDGVASLTPPKRLALAEMIHPNAQRRRKPKPVRRVWIPKPNAPGEQRPLGIPVMQDRACQALAKQALEPEWEARFEPNSYGFRPGRGGHDAIQAIFLNVCHKAKYVLDADIKGAFDHLAHTALLDKLATYPAMRRTVKGWLTAGILEAGVYSSSEEGAPQGGVISPLLMNVALHGMETTLSEAFSGQEGKPTLVRYADDFVVFHTTQAGIEKAWQIVGRWLHDMGLELKPSKTHVAHTLTPFQGRAGFDFLGMTIQQYAVGRTHSAKSSTGEPLGFKTIIRPSQEAVKRHTRALNQVVRAYQHASQDELIAHLNPIIKGWANYYRTVVSKGTYTQCDHLLYQRLWRWARRRHPTKNARWITSKYWRVNQGEGWTFQAQDDSRLIKHAATPIKRHVKVKHTASPYDGNLIYWAQRLKDHPLTGTRTGILLKVQHGQCGYCGLYFKPGDLLEIDHLIPPRFGGDERLMNLQVLHRHCHDQKTAKLDAALAAEHTQVSVTGTI